MTFRARADLITNLTDVTNGIDMNNVTALSTRPKILINNNDASDSGGDYASGTLDLIEESYQFERINHAYRNERYFIPAEFVIVDQSNETNVKEILEEISRVIDQYTKDGTHEYEYEFRYTVSRDRGDVVADIEFVLHKQYVAL